MFGVYLCDSVRKVRQIYLLPHFRYVSADSAVIKLLQKSTNNYNFSCSFMGWKLGISLEKKIKRNVIISKQAANMNVMT